MTDGMRRVHLAVVIDYVRGSISAADVQEVLEYASWWSDPSTVKVTVVVVSESTHKRLLDAANEP